MAAYGTDTGMQEWLDANGLILPPGATLTTLRNIGSAYIDAAYGAKLACSRRTGGFTQELEWPRTGHVINGEVVPDDLIPPAWILASYRAAYLEATNAGWATGSTDPNRLTRREKVDVIEREFMTAQDLGQTSSSAAGINADGIINGMVLPWLCSGVRRFDSLFRVI